jgi:hypothetical protein
MRLAAPLADDEPWACAIAPVHANEEQARNASALCRPDVSMSPPLLLVRGLNVAWQRKRIFQMVARCKMKTKVMRAA